MYVGHGEEGNVGHGEEGNVGHGEEGNVGHGEEGGVRHNDIALQIIDSAAYCRTLLREVVQAWVGEG